MIPKSADVVSPADTRALLAVMVVHKRQGHASLPEISLAAPGQLPKTTLYQQLANLRARGLVDWKAGHHGSIHPLVRLVDLAEARP